jgi:Dyp-type peroxidase family
MSRRPSSPGLHDVQGNVLHPFGYGFAVHLFLHVDGERSARVWLGAIAPTVTDAVDWTGAKPACARNVSITFAGLRALGTDDPVLKAFPGVFQAGMAGRSGVLGDHGASAPEHWGGRLGTGAAHILVSLYAVDMNTLDRELEDLRSSVKRAGLDVVFEQRTAQLEGAREHFGFSDGFSQPTIAGVVPMPGADGVPDRNKQLRPLPVGEFIHGHPDVDGPRVEAPPAPFHRNGTYQVWRKLAQDVDAFRGYTAERAKELDTTPDTVAAKMIGRWQDGTPLALFPDRPGGESLNRDAINNFCYGDDPNGVKCPLGAHVRRTNPRDGLSFGGAMTARHRMIRRGMPYTDGDDRGLVFIAFVADIERQFEFVQQQWCNDGDAFGLGDDRDPIVGRHPAGRAAVEKMTIGGSPPSFLSPLREFVTTRGGEYLLTPSISALYALADGRG